MGLLEISFFTNTQRERERERETYFAWEGRICMAGTDYGRSPHLCSGQ